MTDAEILAELLQGMGLRPDEVVVDGIIEGALHQAIPIIRRYALVDAAALLSMLEEPIAAMLLLDASDALGENGRHEQPAEMGDTESRGEDSPQEHGHGVPDAARSESDDPDRRD